MVKINSVIIFDSSFKNKILKIPTGNFSHYKYKTKSGNLRTVLN
nr:MAG TPA_asm: hypothetical protein [Bacteriophage sp.]